MADVSCCELVERKVRMKDVVYKKKTRNRNEGCFCMAESGMWEEIFERENFLSGRNSKLRNNVARVTQIRGLGAAPRAKATP